MDRSKQPKFAQADLPNGRVATIALANVTYVLRDDSGNATFFFTGGSSLVTTMRYYSALDSLAMFAENSEGLDVDDRDSKLRDWDASEEASKNESTLREFRP